MKSYVQYPQCLRSDTISFALFIITSPGKYIYIEASKGNYNDRAKLLYRGLSSGNVCFRFFYHMYGVNVKTLNLYNGGKLEWTLSGDQGNKWAQAEVDLNGNYDVRMAAFSIFLSANSGVFLIFMATNDGAFLIFMATNSGAFLTFMVTNSSAFFTFMATNSSAFLIFMVINRGVFYIFMAVS